MGWMDQLGRSVAERLTMGPCLGKLGGLKLFFSVVVPACVEKEGGAIFVRAEVRLEVEEMS